MRREQRHDPLVLNPIVTNLAVVLVVGVKPVGKKIGLDYRLVPVALVRAFLTTKNAGLD
jgi:hypothetical protein